MKSWCSIIQNSEEHDVNYFDRIVNSQKQEGNTVCWLIWYWYAQKHDETVWSMMAITNEHDGNMLRSNEILYTWHRTWWYLRPDGIHTEKHDNAILRHSWHSLRSNEKVFWAWFNSSQEQLFRVTYDGIHHGTRWKYMHSGTAWSWFEARWHSQRFMMEMWRGIYWEAWFHSLRIMMEILWHTVPHTHKSEIFETFSLVEF